MTDAEPPDDTPVRILVVDDDEGVRDTVCDVLTELGYVAEPARDGADALDRFRPGRYRLVVTDLGMPAMNGLQLACRLRALQRRNGTVTDGTVPLTGHVHSPEQTT